MKKNYWAIAAGDVERNYIDLCIRLNVVLDGPGVYGPFNENEYRKHQDKGSKMVSELDYFCNKVKEGDIVALRIGLNCIYAVGKVVGHYVWNDLFADVDGWDLQHTRRVKWFWVAPKIDGNYIPHKVSKSDQMTIGTTKRIISDEIIKWIESINSDPDKDIFLPQIPIVDFDNKQNRVEIEDIADYLYSKGMSTSSIENLVSVIDDLTMIAKWYNKEKKAVSEFETEAFLILPLLRALGWSPQKMALEYSADGRKRIDVALFNKLPRDDDNVIAIIEAKRKDRSCLQAFEQAKEYAKIKQACNRIIVSDGIRYGIFVKKNNEFELHAYMNITDPREEYYIWDCKGIKEALWTLSPEWCD